MWDTKTRRRSNSPSLQGSIFPLPTRRRFIPGPSGMTETDGHVSGTTHATGTPETASVMALSAASRERADELLAEQAAFVRLQAKELEHELRLKHWSLRFGNVSAVMKVSFEIALAFIMLAIAG